ncbi:unnamed protein product [Arctia plantaginis]|uniref:Uncharacterized protein n=1 Tax=Arctia plantaginis TaxID=874455 RepID=A0A8S0Z624_ARCPL|nr:unnamed protein product [Arctia plantaginis]
MVSRSTSYRRVGAEGRRGGRAAYSRRHAPVAAGAPRGAEVSPPRRPPAGARRRSAAVPGEPPTPPPTPARSIPPPAPAAGAIAPLRTRRASTLHVEFD